MSETADILIIGGYCWSGMPFVMVQRGVLGLL